MAVLRQRLRSILDVPGGSDRKLRKALAGGADGLMVCLEDGVPEEDGAKRAARDVVAAEVGATDKTLIIRVNAVDSPWFEDDVRLAVRLGFNGIVVPKMTTITELRKAADLLDRLGAPKDLAVWAIVESPAFLLAIERAEHVPARLQALIAGLVDFMLQLTPRAFIAPEGLDADAVLERKANIRMRILMAARAHGCRAVDAITIPSITDTALAAADAARCRDTGFDSTIVLHPAQIEPVNAAFDLSTAERKTIDSILEAGKAAAAIGRTSALVDGRVVLPQHVKAASHYLATYGKGS